MRIGFIGLGKMGSRMAMRLLEKKFEVVVHARHAEAMRPLARNGAMATNSYEEFAEKLGKKNKVIFLMVPHGKPVDEVIENLLPFLSRGDTIIDGGNSFYRDSVKRAGMLARKGIHFLDVGVSGGLEGARNGASIMVGGSEKAFRKCRKIFAALAVRNGFGYMGKSGAGHFVKMVHNGMEYSLMQAYGEGYELLARSRYGLDLRKVTSVYRNGSVIRSWLLDLLLRALEKDKGLAKQSGVVGGGSTGEWTLKTAGESGLKLPLLREAMLARKRSFRKPDFSTKVVAALRRQFGGHEAPKRLNSADS